MKIINILQKRNNMKANNLILPNGELLLGNFEFNQEKKQWSTFSPIKIIEEYDGKAMFSIMPVVDMHFHGVKDIDFSDLKNFSLEKTNYELKKEGIIGIPTIYVPKNEFSDLIELLNNFLRLKKERKLKNIGGFSLEGPVLSSIGGTPTEAAWIPSIKDWEYLLSSCGDAIIYIVLSPDITLTNLNISEDYMKELINLLLKYQVYPALGHFVKEHPAESAHKVRKIIDMVTSKTDSNINKIITDHLLNDMPVNIKYSWRTKLEKKTRNEEALEKELSKLNLQDTKKYFGDVPFSIIENSVQEKALAFINADGDHVDKTIVKHLIRIIQPKNIIIMTDRSKSLLLAKRKLNSNKENTLLYQEKGIVACGTQSIEQQIHNLFEMGLNTYDILQMFSLNPYKLLERSSKNILLDIPILPSVFIKDKNIKFLYN